MFSFRIFVIYLLLLINNLEAFSSIVKNSKRLSTQTVLAANAVTSNLIFLVFTEFFRLLFISFLALNGSNNSDDASSRGIVSKISRTVKSALDGYNTLLEKYPYRTKFISSGIVGILIVSS